MIGPSEAGRGERGLFPLGRVVATSNAVRVVEQNGILRSLSRHVSGDWGEVCADDWRANDVALRDGARLLSVYRSAGGTRFYVITEADRSLTTVLLPEDC